MAEAGVRGPAITALGSRRRIGPRSSRACRRTGPLRRRLGTRSLAWLAIDRSDRLWLKSALADPSPRSAVLTYLGDAQIVGGAGGAERHAGDDDDAFALGGMIEAYTEVARRLGVMQENETLRTGTPKLVK